MTYKENIRAILECYFTGFKREIIDSACNRILEQEPYGDSISRQAVLEVLKDKWNAFSDANDAMQESIDTIEVLPPVNPQPKTGHWIAIEEIEGLGNCKCSVCNHYYYTSGKMLWNYCPYCGAKRHEHSWTEATCTMPKTCTVCGETEGEALGHQWSEADNTNLD